MNIDFQYIWEEDKVLLRMCRDCDRFIDYIPESITTKTITEFSTQRVLTSGPRQGPYDPMYTPYFIEPVDWLSINSIGQRTILLKPAQIGGTTAVENLIAYYMKEYPASQIYMSGTEKLLKTWALEKLEQAIDSFGIRKLITAQTKNKKAQPTGDVAFMKMYHGCVLDLITARSAPSMRNKARQILIRDEIDSAPRSLTTGEGNFLDVTYARTNSYGNRRKIFDLSTPTTENSLIYEEFLRGDQRYFMVPCPECGAYQKLEFGNDYTDFGLKGEFNSRGDVKNVWYLCKHCHKQIKEHKKRWMLDRGEWEATAVPENKFWRSYSINSLYAAPGMIDWAELLLMWTKAKEEREKLISFTNLYMGMPYIEDTSAIKVKDIINIESSYKSKEVPENVLWLTMAADVQIGSKVDKRNPPRIEVEVLGHSRNYRTWSIEYLVFTGSTMDAYDGAFQKLYEWMEETKCMYKTKDGIDIGICIGAIDSGDGRVLMPIVYDFCKRTNGFLFPCKGFGKLKKKDGERWYSDIPGEQDKIKYRIKKIDNETMLLEVATVYYKDNLYSNLRKTREEGDIQKPGFCEFPRDYDKSFFNMLTSEEKNSDDGSYSAKGRRNEALDCRIYNMAVSDFYLDYNVKKMRETAIKKGMDKNKAEQKIRTANFITLIERGLNKRRLEKNKNRNISKQLKKK